MKIYVKNLCKVNTFTIVTSLLGCQFYDNHWYGDSVKNFFQMHCLFTS